MAIKKLSWNGQISTEQKDDAWLLKEIEQATISANEFRQAVAKARATRAYIDGVLDAVMKKHGY